MKKKMLKLFFLFVTSTVISERGLSQHCKTAVLGINTGFDYIGGTVIPVGTQDNNWLVTNLSSACLNQAPPTVLPSWYPNPAATSIVFPYYAYSVSWPGGGWLTPSNSQWISFLPQYFTFIFNSYYPTQKMTLTRRFGTWVPDLLTFNLTIASDNYIPDMRLDGTSVFSQPGSVPTNWSTYTTWTSTVYLAAGVHYIDVDLLQDNQPGSNPFGLDIEGTIASATNTTSLWVNNCASTNNPSVNPTCAFSYCLSTLSPYGVTLIADPSETFNYPASGAYVANWYINGSLAGTGSYLQHGFPTSSSTYDVEWEQTNPFPSENTECFADHQICLGTALTQPSCAGTHNPNFTLCYNNANFPSNIYTLSADDQFQSGYLWTSTNSSFLPSTSSNTSGTFNTGDNITLTIGGSCQMTYTICNPLYKSTSISTVQNQHSFTVNPNPANDILNVHYVEPSHNAVQFVLKDLMGKELKTYTQETNNKDFNMNISELAAGIYLLSANNGTSVKTLKVVKN